MILGKLGIADNDIDVGYFAEFDKGLLAEFGGVGQKNYFLGLVHHFFFGFDEEEILVVEAGFVDAGHGEEHGFGMDGAKHLFGHGAQQHAVAGVDQAAGDDELDVFVVGEEGGDGEGIGDELDVEAEKFLR